MKKDIPSETPNLKIMPLILLLALFWGGNSPAVKIALRDMPPFILAALRFTLAAIAIWAWVILRKIPIAISSDEFQSLGILATIFAAQIITFTVGTHLSLAGRAALLINTHPFFVALLAHFFIPSDRLTIKKIIGLIVAFVGVATIFRENFISGNPSYLLGDLILLLSSVILSIQTIYVKKVVQKINPIKLLTWQMSFGLILFYATAFIFEGPSQWHVTWNVVGALAYQGLIVGTFCFLTWTTLLRKYSASRISAFLFMTPVFGVILSSLILGEKVTLWFGIGLTLVAAGIYIVNSSKDS